MTRSRCSNWGSSRWRWWPLHCYRMLILRSQISIFPVASSSMNRNVSSASCLKVRYGRGGLRWKTPLNCGVLKALNSVWLLTRHQLLPRFAVERELSTGQLKELPFGAPSLSIMALCAHHAGKAVSPAMQIFMQCMEACFTVEDKNAGLTNPALSSLFAGLLLHFRTAWLAALTDIFVSR